MSQSSPKSLSIEPRTIRGVNTIGLYTLIEREVGRFLSVYLQTIIAPMITTLLFYTVFALAFGGVAREIGGIPFLEFLAPGLIMMSMVQNAFVNTSSSLMISKLQGNIVDTVMPPLSNVELFIGLALGGVIRGLVVGLATGAAIAVFAPMNFHSVGVIVTYAVLGNMMMASLGVVTGIYADKFDHVAAITNFVVTPLTFLSGTFYSVESLPEVWRDLALYNPFFYMIDGFRSGFTGQGDSSVMIGVLVLCAVNFVLTSMALWMLRVGYKIKS